MARLISYQALLCYKLYQAHHAGQRPVYWNLRGRGDRSDGRTLCWCCRFLVFTIWTREIRAMEEHYVGAAGSWCLLYEPREIWVIEEHYVDCYRFLAFTIMDPGDSKRWRNIMLMHQIPAFTIMNPGKWERWSPFMLVAVGSSHYFVLLVFS